MAHMEGWLGIQEPSFKTITAVPASASTVGDRMLSFLKDLAIDKKLPTGVKVLSPYKDPYTFSLCTIFYQKYYADNDQRTLLLGINPGRFGSGTTGISFTDPLKLENVCGIANTLQKKPELSADFMYRMMEAYGGHENFYKTYLVSAISPLGFTREGKNINYYDIPALQKAVMPFIIKSIGQLLTIGVSREKCFCIGEGKNFIFLKDLNNKQGWFKEVIPLAHPRFIMQYRRKKISEFIDRYVTLLAQR
jgi:hypothetical protein